MEELFGGAPAQLEISLDRGPEKRAEPAAQEEPVKRAARGKGEYRPPVPDLVSVTPVSIVRTLVAMLEPERGVVFDPCCGSGGMFVQADQVRYSPEDLDRGGEEPATRQTLRAEKEPENRREIALACWWQSGVRSGVRSLDGAGRSN